MTTIQIRSDTHKKIFIEQVRRYVTLRQKYTNSTVINSYLNGIENAKPIAARIRLLHFIKKAYIESRIMRTPELNNDVAHLVKSYIPHSARLNSLRKKYTNEILKQGLQKKTVKQLDHILENIIETIDKGFLSNYKTWFITVGIDVPSAMDRKNIPFGFLFKYRSISGNKQSKVDRIMEFYQRACDIMFRKQIPKFYNHYKENGRRTLYIHPLKKLAMTHREDLSQRVIKLLCILTIVIKASPKSKK